jgi:hypothetical protein
VADKSLLSSTFLSSKSTNTNNSMWLLLPLSTRLMFC